MPDGRLSAIAERLLAARRQGTRIALDGPELPADFEPKNRMGLPRQTLDIAFDGTQMWVQLGCRDTTWTSACFNSA